MIYVSLLELLRGEPEEAWLVRLDSEANVHKYLVTPDSITGERPARRLWDVIGRVTDSKPSYVEALQQVRAILADLEQKKAQFPKHRAIRH